MIARFPVQHSIMREELEAGYLTKAVLLSHPMGHTRSLFSRPVRPLLHRVAVKIREPGEAAWASDTMTPPSCRRSKKQDLRYDVSLVQGARRDVGFHVAAAGVTDQNSEWFSDEGKKLVVLDPRREAFL